MTIEIGTVITQNASMTFGYSYINYNVPATGSGTITAVTFEVHTETADLTIIIFELVAADTFTARSYQVLGVKAVGLHSDVAVSLAVVVGDYIGCYYSAGRLYQDDSGELAGVYYLAGDQKECVDTDFTGIANDSVLYLYGTGIASAAPIGGAGGAELLLAGQI